jgi:hypothetical protein
MLHGEILQHLRVEDLKTSYQLSAISYQPNPPAARAEGAMPSKLIADS